MGGGGRPALIILDFDSYTGCEKIRESLKQPPSTLINLHQPPPPSLNPHSYLHGFDNAMVILFTRRSSGGGGGGHTRQPTSRHRPCFGVRAKRGTDSSRVLSWRGGSMGVCRKKGNFLSRILQASRGGGVFSVGGTAT